MVISQINQVIWHADYEVILVDNASTDGSFDVFCKLGKQCHNFHYIWNDTNLGFAVASNIGAKMAKGDILIFLNPDVEIREQDLDLFVAESLKDEIGVLAPRLIYPDGSVQPNGGGYATLFTYVFQLLKLGYFSRKLGITGQLARVSRCLPFMRKSIIGKYLKNFLPDRTNAVSFDWVSGACMIIRKSLFDEVGGFDERFFMYDEDEDLCRRIANLGYDIVVDGRFRVIHMEKGTQNRQDVALNKADRERLKSNIYYLGKHSGRLRAEILRYIIISYLVCHLSIQLVSNRKYVKGQIASIREIARYKIT